MMPLLLSVNYIAALLDVRSVHLGWHQISHSFSPLVYILVTAYGLLDYLSVSYSSHACLNRPPKPYS